MAEQKEIKIFYDPYLSDKQIEEFVKSEVQKIEDQGYKIVVFEPMEKIIAISIGIRLLVEKKEQNAKIEGSKTFGSSSQKI